MPQESITIRPCTPADEPVMDEIINDAAEAYRGVIPADRFHDPYLPPAELASEIAAGVRFWGAEKAGVGLIGVMGIQDEESSDHDGIGDVTLIRHAYVRTAFRRQGVGGLLIRHLRGLTSRPMLIGTWAAAAWAVDFYEKHGYVPTTRPETERLLRIYWKIPERQVETSVVLADQAAMNRLRGGQARKVSAAAEFADIEGYWNPRTVGVLNGQLVKFVRLKGQFEWHRHAVEDEMFFVLSGELVIRLRDRDVRLGPGEFFVIPHGVEHMPVAEAECRAMLFEPAATKQHGD